ncbi:chromate resistance protein ChrB domain-containing protein [Streptomyces sp. NPDC059982]|uniref:chromate resistance protein ChrB domain-containing protein n=1 Tax=unclassified Streptomyces TaxID=2593676 RepID=UPI0036C1B83C
MRIAQIVHEADIDDGCFHAPEAPGLDVVLRGLSMTGDDTQLKGVRVNPGEDDGRPWCPARPRSPQALGRAERGQVGARGQNTSGLAVHRSLWSMPVGLTPPLD